jgi:hypothetical protein
MLNLKIRYKLTSMYANTAYLAEEDIKFREIEDYTSKR